MIEITFKPNTYELEINGHAGHDVKGKDIVCAAVSTLFYTLGQALMESGIFHEDELEFKDEEGNGYIGCSCKRYYEESIESIYWPIMVGFKMLANQYPENVSFKIEG